MVTVVLNSREHRTKRVENNTFYTVLFKLSGVIARQKEKTAEIVIHDADGNAICRLALKNIQNGVPHIAFLNNKIFKKNIFFRFFQHFVVFIITIHLYSTTYNYFFFVIYFCFF